MKNFLSLCLAVTLSLFHPVALGSADSFVISKDNQAKVGAFLDETFNPELTEAELAKIYNESNYKNDFVPGEVIVGMKTSVAGNCDIATLFSGLQIAEVCDPYEEIIAALSEDGPIDCQNEPVMAALSEAEITAPDLHVLENSRVVYTLKLASETKESVLEAIEILKKDPNVAYAEPNYLLSPAVTPTDYTNYNLWGMEKIQAPQAWDITVGSYSVQVGVLDTGFDYTHPDLADNIDRGLAYCVSAGTYGYAADIGESTGHGTYYGHGTHVAGIIGAVGNNYIGTAGVNWNVTIVPIKIAISDSNASTNMSLVRSAVVYATALGLPVINLSYGVSYSQSLIDAVNAYQGLLVIAAGNDNANNNNNTAYSSLHASDNVIFVANSTSDDTLSSTSNYGDNNVDLAAPGSSIYSTIPDNSYGSKSGTSMAAPHVTGVAALIKSIRPDLDAGQIKSCILKGTTTVSGLSGKCATGGRLNALNALQLAQGLYTTVTITGDYNGDGQEDLALIKSYPFSDTVIEVCLSTGSAYTAATTWWRSGAGIFNMDWVKDRVAAGDFDGDGKDEIVVFYGYSDNRMNIIAFDPQNSAVFQKAIWRSYPAGTWEASRLDGTIMSGDFVANVGNVGKDELVGIYQYAAGDVKFFVWRFSLEDAVPVLTQSVWRQYSAGTFNTSWMQGMVTAGDLDNDGYDEYIIGYGYDNHAFKVLRYKYSASLAGFESSVWYNAPAGSFKIDRMRNRFTFLDFDDVSYKEIGFIYLQDNGNVDFILVNNIVSSRCLRSFTAAQFNATLCSHVSFGDTDGDGEKEMIVIYQYPPSLYKIFSYTPSKTIDYGNI